MYHHSIRIVFSFQYEKKTITYSHGNKCLLRDQMCFSAEREAQLLRASRVREKKRPFHIKSRPSNHHRNTRKQILKNYERETPLTREQIYK